MPAITSRNSSPFKKIVTFKSEWSGGTCRDLKQIPLLANKD
ncbi:hypothetical protein SLEP1_g6926 [Rubroshorea leprosula]|uniref:Uncharacterized protein n=1 Tax=Rubroshorea leprosula TaxID=152421 RepID=A0AAV5HWS1_9ROSI|nr:hypothetical protein SLEP1_g6924 [Rubroshorea leprosula]GKU93324.1 hypothetical protein SLEP1_g6926 [Rubroshorea leprosula]